MLYFFDHAAFLRPPLYGAPLRLGPVYALLLVGSLTLIGTNVAGWMPLRALVGLTPMSAGFGILNLVMQEYRSADELQRRIVAESIMFAFGSTALLTFSYGFLQRTIGAPELSYFWVWPILAASWIVGGIITRRRYR